MNTIRLVYEIQADAPATWPAATHGVRNQFVPVHDPQRDPSGLGLLASLARYCLGDVPNALNDAVVARIDDCPADRTVEVAGSPPDFKCPCRTRPPRVAFRKDNPLLPRSHAVRA